MKKFMVIYYAPFGAVEQMANSTPEEMAKGMEGWMNWAKQCGEKLIDMGTPLANGLALLPGGKSNKSSKQVTGFSVLQANNLDEAKNLLVGHPHLGWNAECSIEVYESMPIPGM